MIRILMHSRAKYLMLAVRISGKIGLRCVRRLNDLDSKACREAIVPDGLFAYTMHGRCRLTSTERNERDMATSCQGTGIL